MKIYFGSDLHLEFETGETSIVDVPTGDVLLLAGDIFTPWATMDDRHQRLAQEFFARCAANFTHVLYVAGNHDSWNGTLNRTADVVAEMLKQHRNITVLDNSAYQIGHIIVWGSTFWTDARGADPQVMWHIKRGMNDYTNIKGPHGHNMLVEDTYEANRFARRQLTEFMSAAEQKGLFPIIMTHHAPTWVSVSGRYRTDDLSYAYANTGLEDMLLDFPPSVWIHGHVHEEIEYYVGNCRVLCHPRGYLGYQVSADNYQLMELTDVPSAQT